MLTRKTEDYLEAICNITEEKGYARVKDIASKLNISPPSVTEMMKKLRDRGFVLYEKYGGITLTDKGKKVAEEVKKRHDIFEIFLKNLLAEEETSKNTGAIEEYLESVMEDYLEAVYNMTGKKEHVKIKDIASELEVSSSIVTEMMRKLHDRGFIAHEKYSGITLTDKGEKIAERVKKRHEIFENFLKIILVEENVASKDACIMEHHLDPQTIEQFSKLVEFVKNSPIPPKWLSRFKEYCETEKKP